MNKKQITLLILVDLLFLGVMGFQVWSRYQVLQGGSVSLPVPEPANVPALPQVPEPETVAPSEVPGDTPAVEKDTAPVQTPTLSASEVEPKSRRTFVLRNPAATSVQLVGDFNQWTPQEFQKESDGRWTFSIPLAPGNYSYNLIVDGNVIRDPNQRRTDEKGRSLLTVAP
jgi:hypothetical protein